MSFMTRNKLIFISFIHYELYDFNQFDCNRLLVFNEPSQAHNNTIIIVQSHRLINKINRIILLCPNNFSSTHNPNRPIRNPFASMTTSNSHEQLNRKTTCLPLEFEYIPVEILSKEFTKLNNPHPYRIHYLGPRYKNTLEMHKKNAHTQKKPFVYNSALFGDFLPKTQTNYNRSKQLSINPNQSQVSSQQDPNAQSQKNSQPLEKSVAQNFDQPSNLIDKYKIDMRKIVHSFLLEEKLKNAQFFKTNVYYRAFQGMNPSLNLQDQFTFNSCFEGGNLDCAIKLDQREFDLFLRIDSNTRGHLLWFYFSVKNQRKTGKIRMNICNFSKSKTLYKEGLRPYVFSNKKYKKQGKSWQQSGVNLGLEKKDLRYQVLEDKYNGNNANCLTIEYNFEYQKDEVFFSYCIPYTYSQLLHDIEGLPDKYVQKKSLGRSLLGTNIPILHITDNGSKTPSKSKIPPQEADSTTTNIASDRDQLNIPKNEPSKRLIFATGRIHPSESNSSYVIMGFIRWLCSDDKEAVELRKIARFIIVPMVNPDGVIIGNSRTSASGKDLNRQYISPDPSLHPQICLIKQFAKKIHKDHEIKLFLDFHGHSRKKNTFFYGPVYNISEPNYYKCRILPKLIQKISNPFRYHSCSFNLIQEKKKTARASMFESLGIQYTYTVQSSIGYFYDCELLKIFEFSQQQWCKMGSAIAQGTCQFIVGVDQYQNILIEKRKERLKKKRFYKNLQPKVEYLEDEMFIDIQTGQEPLKIIYEDKDAVSVKRSQKIKKSNMFMELLEQIKTTTVKKSPQKNQARQVKTTAKQFDPTQLDIDDDSDSHDENEDLQMKRLKQFSNLVKQDLKNQSFSSKQNHLYDIKFDGENEKNKKTNIKSQKDNKLISQFELLNELQLGNKFKARNIKTGQGLRIKIKQDINKTNVQTKLHKQKTLPQQLHEHKQLTNNEEIIHSFQTNMSRVKRPVYTSAKRENRNTQSPEKRQKTIGNYFGEYRLLITDTPSQNQKKKDKHDLIRKLQSRRDNSRKKRAESSNQFKACNIDYCSSLPMNASSIVGKMEKTNLNDAIHRPTQFTFCLPFSQMADNTKSYILKPKLKIHIKQKPHSVQNFQNSMSLKQKEHSINMRQKTQKSTQGFFQSQKDSARESREKKVSQSYLIQHGFAQFNRHHQSQKTTARDSNNCTKIDFGDAKNSSLINTLKIYQM